MSGISGAISYAGKHPVTVAVGVFAVGAVLLLLLRGNGGGQTSDGGMNAFYAAQAAQASSGNALLAAQKQVMGAIAINQQNTDAAVKINASNNTLALGLNEQNVAEANYETYKQVRLATQIQEHAYYLAFTKDRPELFGQVIESMSKRPLYFSGN